MTVRLQAKRAFGFSRNGCSLSPKYTIRPNCHPVTRTCSSTGQSDRYCGGIRRRRRKLRESDRQQVSCLSASSRSWCSARGMSALPRLAVRIGSSGGRAWTVARLTTLTSSISTSRSCCQRTRHRCTILAPIRTPGRPGVVQAPSAASTMRIWGASYCRVACARTTLLQSGTLYGARGSLGSLRSRHCRRPSVDSDTSA